MTCRPLVDAPPATAVQAVLFDKDGTLVDLDRAWIAAGRAAARRLCDEAGAPRAFARLLARGGYDAAGERLDPHGLWASGTTEELLRVWMAELGLSADGVRLAREIARMTDEASARARPLADLGAVFRSLRRRGIAIGIATMDLERSARTLIDALCLEDLVSFVCGCDSGHGEKPGPGMVHAFCAARGLAPARIMVVGDTPHDMRMARAAGAGWVVGVTSGAGDRAGLAALADRVLEDIGAVGALIDALAAQAAPPPGGAVT